MNTVINFCTDALGDSIAFSPYADEYQKIYGGSVYVKTKYFKILTSNNPNVYFVEPKMEIKHDKYYEIHFHFKDVPIQKLACDQLGIEYKEIIPTIKQSSVHKFNKKKKYVCIGTHSTAQLKYWNNSAGWDSVVKYIKSLGYDVYVIDKDEVFGSKEKWNTVPKKAFNETGNYPIEYRIEQLKNCSFFVGLSSGLSWLAWALNKKVVLISGCTEEYNEFTTNCYRVINKNVCHGCLNDVTLNNKDGILSGWMYCPRQKDFECSKKITFDMVREQIDRVVQEL